MNYHLIEAKYLPSTTTKPGRIKLSSFRFKQSIIIPRGEADYWYNEAIDYLIDKKFKVTGNGESKEGMIIITSTFKGLNKI